MLPTVPENVSSLFRSLATARYAIHAPNAAGAKITSSDLARNRRLHRHGSRDEFCSDPYTGGPATVTGY